jgi:hypothetical protein
MSRLSLPHDAYFHELGSFMLSGKCNVMSIIAIIRHMKVMETDATAMRSPQEPPHSSVS